MFIRIENEIINLDHIIRADLENEEGSGPVLKIRVTGGSDKIHYTVRTFDGENATKTWERLLDVTGTR